MNLSLMRLESVFLLSLTIEANAEWDPSVKPESGELVEPEFDFSVYRHVEVLRFNVRLRIKSNWPESPAWPLRRVEVDLMGVYSFPNGTEEERSKEYVPTLCLVNLYSLARGIVVQSTGTCPGGAYHFPLVDMNKVVNEQAKRMQTLRLQTELTDPSRKKTRTVRSDRPSSKRKRS